jgi:hypothetical protein
MVSFRRMRTLQQFASVHPPVRTLFSAERAISCQDRSLPAAPCPSASDVGYAQPDTIACKQQKTASHLSTGSAACVRWLPDEEAVHAIADCRLDRPVDVGIHYRHVRVIERFGRQVLLEILLVDVVIGHDRATK